MQLRWRNFICHPPHQLQTMCVGEMCLNSHFDKNIHAPDKIRSWNVFVNLCTVNSLLWNFLPLKFTFCFYYQFVGMQIGRSIQEIDSIDWYSDFLSNVDTLLCMNFGIWVELQLIIFVDWYWNDLLKDSALKSRMMFWDYLGMSMTQVVCRSDV